MRTITAAQEQILASRHRSEHLRVKIKDPDSKWHDLSKLFPAATRWGLDTGTIPNGTNWIAGANWGGSVDQPLDDATISLYRDRQGYTHAPLRSSAFLCSDGHNLVWPGREMRIETALLPRGAPLGYVTPVVHSLGVGAGTITLNGVPSVSCDIKFVVLVGAMEAAIFINGVNTGYTIAVDSTYQIIVDMQPSLFPFDVYEYMSGLTITVVLGAGFQDGDEYTATAVTSWIEVFHGYIDSVAWEENPITVQCRDKAAKLQDKWIEQELVYGIEENYNFAAAWTASSAVRNGSTRRPSAGSNGKGYSYTGTNGLTNATTEPTWPLTPAAPTTDRAGQSYLQFVGALSGMKFGARAWQPSTVYALRDVVYLPVNDGTNFIVMECSVAGTSSSKVSGIAFPAPDIAYGWTYATEITDNTAKWRVRSNLYMLPDWSIGYPGLRLDGAITAILMEAGLGFAITDLSVPVAPSWKLNPWRQKRTNVLEAVRALASQIGWDVRYKWNAAASAFKLTLYQPDRAKVLADRTIQVYDYKDIKGIKISIEGIRNVVDVIYSDSATLAPNGTDFVRKRATSTDAASVTKYGRRWCEIAEDSSSNINTSTEAQALADAVCRDLSEPSADQEATTRYLWPLELGDLLKFKANNIHYSSDQNLAVASYRHEFANDSIRSTIRTRGKPSGGFKKWHRAIAKAPTMIDRPPPPSGIGHSDGVGQATIWFLVFRQGLNQFDWLETELHVSAASGFTPSAATLEARGRTDNFVVNRDAGTYYFVLVNKDTRGNISVPSAEASFTTT